MEPVEVLARRGVWVAHQTVTDWGRSRLITITHVPTGRAATTSCRNLKQAVSIMRKLAALPGKWTATDPKKLPKRGMAAGKELMRKVIGHTA